MIDMFKNNFYQVTKDGLFFPPSEEEVLGVEHLLVEPKYDLVDDVLGSSTFSRDTCFKIDEISNVEYCSPNAYEGAKDSNIDPGQKAKGQDVFFGRPDATTPKRKNNISDVCEDYLIDIDIIDESCDFNSLNIPYGGDLGVKSKYLVPSRGQCGSEMQELAAERKTVTEKMTKPSGNKFECETTVTNKQSPLHHFSTVSEEFLEPFDDNEGQTVLPKNDRCLKFGSCPFADVFSNFRRKPRLQHRKRGKREGIVSFKALSFEVREKGDLLAARKRPRRPTRRYIEESMEENMKYQNKRWGVFGTRSKDNVPNNGVHRKLHQKRSSAKFVICQKEPSEGACIQVPFGLPVNIKPSKKKEPEREQEYVDDSEQLGSSSSSSSCSISSGSNTESVSIDSQDDLSEDDCCRESKIQRYQSPRKHHNYWSLSEVLMLVEGVSKYGVGRWTEIKRQHFDSSKNRTPVDLKDKWRNLLRASCSISRGNSEVGTKKKHPSQSIPQAVLHQVRELAAVYPYPRERPTRRPATSPTPAGTTTTTKAPNSLIHMPTAVRV